MYQSIDFQEEENILIEQATRRKEEEAQKRINKEKAYLTRKNILGKYFLRLGTVNKVKFIQRLLSNFEDDKHLLELANFLPLGEAKAFAYSSVCHQTNFKHDKYLLDHDRSLNQKELEDAIESDIQWFKNLKSDQQVDIIIRLIKHSGGHVQKVLLLRILKKSYHHKKTLQTARKSGQDMDFMPFEESEDTINFFDHPATIEVENQRKNWNQIVSKYREKVQAAKELYFEEETKNKKSKKGDTGNKEGEIDWIQLLPIWSVKQIFSYFDQNALQKLKKVNPYWSYVVQELAKERKMRTQLNNDIEKHKAEIGPAVLVEDHEKQLLVELETKPTAKVFKGRRVNYEKGAIVKKLVPKPTDRIMNTSLYNEVMKEITQDYLTANMVSFPREMTDETSIYKYQPCPLRDVDVVLGDQEDIKDAKSFLTYSMSTYSTTLSLPVDRKTLEEW